jgi:hypothetical protein
VILWVAVAACAFEPAGDGGDDVEPEVDAGAGVAAPLRCPSGYASLDGSRTQYRIVETRASWSVAAADCNDDDDELGSSDGYTHLVVVGDELEKAALTNRVGDNTWVGLTDVELEGTFVWVTDEDTGGFPIVGDHPPWDRDDPDGGRTENCVRFKRSYDFEDKRCDEPNRYVCECDRFAP